jgi:hypothetical protein
MRCDAMTTTTMGWDGMGTFADGICGDDVARGARARVAFGARVRVYVVEGFMVHTCASRDGARAARRGRGWARMGCATLARGMAIARDGDRSRAMRDGVVTARGRAWGGVARAGKVA